ncbi:MAG: hypothetical protein E7455_07015 [Ruminococcaceae bacterium]|nr:hypothetical protein [Oscillospiraceae bacterium]
MHVYVDLARLESHVHTLDQQITQARRNIELWQSWRSGAALIPGADLSLVDRQIQFMEQYINNTRTKQKFLREMHETLYRANNRLKDDTVGAVEALKKLE